MQGDAATRSRDPRLGLTRLVAIGGLAMVGGGALLVTVRALLADLGSGNAQLVLLGGTAAVIAAVIAVRGVLNRSRGAVRLGALLQAVGVGLVGCGYLAGADPVDATPLYPALAVAVGFDAFLVKGVAWVEMTRPDEDVEDENSPA